MAPDLIQWQLPHDYEPDLGELAYVRRYTGSAGRTAKNHEICGSNFQSFQHIVNKTATNSVSWPLPILFTALVLGAPFNVAYSDALNAVTTDASRVRHVFIIVLENKNFDDTFGSSRQDPYLQKKLVSLGALLTQYYGTGHASLDNYLSMISGQSPTPDTVEDCVPGLTSEIGNYNDVQQTGTTPDGQVIASGGCIYPSAVKTLADQLAAAGFRWKGYMEDMGNDPARESATCGHPNFGIRTDNTNASEPPSSSVPQGDAYATRHNPFMYFHSIIDSPDCSRNVVNLKLLAADLVHKSTTPNLAFITPNLCHDGHDGDGSGEAEKTCADGEPGGLTSVDAFLRTWVPRILNSPAYKADGLLFITFDEGNYTLTESVNENTAQTIVELTFDGQACCGQRPGPNLQGVRPGTITQLNTPTRVERFTVNGYGGDRIGAVILSPFVRPGSISTATYNHYSLLKSLEDIFCLSKHLGYADDNPQTGYHVDSIGNDEGIFEHTRATAIAANSKGSSGLPRSKCGRLK